MKDIVGLLVCSALVVLLVYVAPGYLKHHENHSDSYPAASETETLPSSASPQKQFSPPSQAPAPQEEKPIAWTPEERVRNPKAYCLAKQQELSSLAEKLETGYIQLSQACHHLETEERKSQLLSKRLEEFLEEAKQCYKQAESSGEWPTSVQNEVFTKERLQKKIVESHERLKSLRESSLQIRNKKTTLQQRRQTQFEKLKRIPALRQKMENVLVDLQQEKQLGDEQRLKAVLDGLESALDAMQSDVQSPSLENLTHLSEEEEQEQRIKDILSE